MLQDAQVASEPFWVQGGERSCTEIPLQTLHGAAPARCFGCASQNPTPACPNPPALRTQPTSPRSTPGAPCQLPSDLLHPLSTRTSSSQSQSCHSCSQSSRSQPKIRPGLRADTCLGLCFVLGRQDADLGRRWGYPWGNSFDVSEEGWNLKADLGFPFSFGIFGAMNTRRH